MNLYSFLIISGILYINFTFLYNNKIKLGWHEGEGFSLISKGNIEVRYVWGLGKKINNQVEAYGLFLGLSLAQKVGIRKIQVLGDSMLIIKHMNTIHQQKSLNLNQIIKRSQEMIPFFDLVSSIHILRGNNQDAYKQSNLACQLNAEIIIVNEVEERHAFPNLSHGIQLLVWGWHSWLIQEVRKEFIFGNFKFSSTLSLLTPRSLDFLPI